MTAGTGGLDHEIDDQAVGGPRLDRADDGHQRSAGSNQTCGPRLDLAADDVKDQVGAADLVRRGVLEIDELLRAE